ncbi:MAG: hypothetical protein JWR61_1010 [Ferruginibacter sp.]|uniref:hypothetical protein n=1 Tax=Ferruginibacter sp. TaxID=1940288 RepID=UPI0026588BD8|nr:hypothetical protein [Ferruginibacter sp.]MDB5276055.1 hypothetical protein [Ferruginibacter sp.]
MKNFSLQLLMMLFGLTTVVFSVSSCNKSNLSPPSSALKQQQVAAAAKLNALTPAIPNFNLEVILRGEGKAFGHVEFRQDNDADKIVTLNTWVRDLEPNHEYQLQRAVDTNLDGNCTGTAWLTLGKGLQPQSIFTDENGIGREELSRNLSAVPSGTTFDIHFQVIDAQSSEVVLTSDCYQFTVR